MFEIWNVKGVDEKEIEAEEPVHFNRMFIEDGEMGRENISWLKKSSVGNK